MIKYFTLIIVALSIDAFQGLIAVSLTAVSLALGGSVALIPLVGTGTATAINLGGMVLGVVMDFCISAVFGSGLLMLMVFAGMVSPLSLFTMRRMPFIVSKFIPFIDALPLYTAMVILCILEKERQTKAGFLGSTLGVAGNLASGNIAGAVGEGMQALSPTQNPAAKDNEQGAEAQKNSVILPQKVPLVDGIRSPNTTGGRNTNNNIQRLPVAA